MLLGRGAVDGVRVLTPRAVSLMTSDYLTAEQRAAIPPPVTSLFRGQGWGLGLSVVLDAALYDETVGTGSPGTVDCPGAFGTWWQLDPREDVIQIYLDNYLMMSSSDPARHRFQNPAYEAIDD